MSAFVRAASQSLHWQIALSASGIAAAQFARCGLDVTVLSGPNKPSHDLVVTNAGCLFKVCVLGSADGRWDPTRSYRKRPPVLGDKTSHYYHAIDLWLDMHDSKTVCCLVQFLGVDFDQLPRIYLASPHEVAQKLRQAAERTGEAYLGEARARLQDADEAGAGETLPGEWLLSLERVEDVLSERATGTPAVPFHAAPVRTITFPARYTATA